MNSSSLTASKNRQSEFYKTVSIVLNEMADLEKSVEMSRQDLICNKGFCATKIFNYLDCRRRGFLTAKDLRLFLEKNSVFVTEQESRLLFD